MLQFHLLNGPSGGGGGGGYTGPLDLTAAAPLVAFGVRALSAAKRGAALFTIRRDSDDHTQSFASDATTGEPPSIASFVGAAASLVALWKDQAAGGNDAGNTTLAQQPTYVAGLIGGKPAIQNTPAVTQLFTAGTLAVPNAMTVFAVWKFPDTASDGTSAAFAMWDGASNTYLAVEPHVTANAIDTIACTIGDEASAADTGDTYISDGVGGYLPEPSPLLFDLAFTHGTNNAFSNGTALDADTATDPVLGARTASPFIIGNDYIPDPSDFGSPLALSELIVFPSILSDADRTAIRANIASYYGIALS